MGSNPGSYQFQTLHKNSSLETFKSSPTNESHVLNTSIKNSREIVVIIPDLVVSLNVILISPCSDSVYHQGNVL